MRIAFDAKRAFQNTSGLGSYSRNLFNGLMESGSEHEFFLFTPNTGKQLYSTDLPENFQIVQSTSLIKPYWRSFSIASDLKAKDIELYHGLSNELPFTLSGGDIKKVVTIHDLLFLRFPNLYPVLDRNIYFHKVNKSLQMADLVIVPSRATEQDLIERLNITKDRIKVVYQSCSDKFHEDMNVDQTEKVRTRHQLPEKFILSVGRLEERKNQRGIIEALSMIPRGERLPLVLVGRGKTYQPTLKKLAEKKGVEVLFRYQVEDYELPAVYRMSSVFVYIPYYEGFGIPVLEAMSSEVPVITSKGTSMEEFVSRSTFLVNPYDFEEISEKLRSCLVKDNTPMVKENKELSLSYTNRNFAESMLAAYGSIQ